MSLCGPRTDEASAKLMVTAHVDGAMVEAGAAEPARWGFAIPYLRPERADD